MNHSSILHLVRFQLQLSVFENFGKTILHAAAKRLFNYELTLGQVKQHVMTHSKTKNNNF